MHYPIKKAACFTKVLQELTVRYPLVRQPIQKKIFRYFDTFDWRLFKKNFSHVSGK